MKYLSITKHFDNSGEPFFFLKVPKFFGKHTRYNKICEKLEKHINGESDTVIHAGNELFVNKSYFKTAYDTPIYIVTKNDDPEPIGVFYMVSTKYIKSWRFADCAIINYDENVENYGYAVEK